MSQPKIELIPLRPAVRADVPITLDVLIKITPPQPERQVQRPALNLGLVLDRSGSMEAHNKIAFAREAAIFAVQQLRPSDRVSVTIYDDKIETLVRNTYAENKDQIIGIIKGIEPGGSTALFDGWKEGAAQVKQNLLPDGLNRVLLLTDGLANQGERRPDFIATEVSRLAQQGVSTTALGLGDDYNEDLLEAIGNAGDGNYYYIESPRQLPGIFEAEVKGLSATVGNTVSLGIEPEEGVALLDVVNDLEKLPNGRLKLTNLIAGSPVSVVVQLQVPPRAKQADLCRFRLAWNAPKVADRQTAWASLSLPVVDAVSWEKLAPNLEVQEHAGLLLIARLKREATRSLERGDADEAARQIAEAKRLLETLPATPATRLEQQAIAALEHDLADGAWIKARKRGKIQAYARQFSK